MKNIALLIEYDGSDLGGWQIQSNAPTVQEEIQNAFFDLTSQHYIILGSGRTDAGVHAAGQVANLLVNDDFPIPENKIAIALNSRLSPNIRILAANYTLDDFHSRFDAIAREYEYNLHTRESVFDSRFSNYYKFPLDEDLLINSAHIFIGEHDFTSFSKNNPSTKSYICKVDMCEWTKVSSSKWQFRVKANRFVYGMVRSLVGSMLDVASERKFPTDLIFGLHNPNRTNFINLAPANGLILKRIYYPNEIIIKNSSK